MAFKIFRSEPDLQIVVGGFTTPVRRELDVPEPAPLSLPAPNVPEPAVPAPQPVPEREPDVEPVPA